MKKEINIDHPNVRFIGKSFVFVINLPDKENTIILKIIRPIVSLNSVVEKSNYYSLNF